ncbi:MAG: DUF541 domain-containing protein [Desulfobulbaceae bacterium]|nr:MAG: DUF541 domain-containing protein [Desulfobulbaceae bacterium]
MRIRRDLTMGLIGLFLIGGLVSPVAAEVGPKGLDGGFTVQISAWAEADAVHDLLRATLTVERSGPDSARLVETVAWIMQRAVSEAERYPEVQVKITAYSTQPVFLWRDGKNEQIGWRVRQSLSVESTVMAEVTELVGRLQDLDLQLTTKGFTVSSARREALQASLTAAAIDAWRIRAEAAVKRLDGQVWRPHELQIQDEQFHPIKSIPGADAARITMPISPVIEAGTSRVRVTVSGTVWGR